jgi:hypothetical protein
MARRKSSNQAYYSRDRRQLGLPLLLPLQGPPSGPRTLATPWGTPAPVRPAAPRNREPAPVAIPRRTRGTPWSKSPQSEHPAFATEIPIGEGRS